MGTDRLSFSRWAKEDFGLAVSLWGDKEVAKYISGSGSFSEREIAARLDLEIANQKQFGVQYWPVFGVNTSEFIGCCGLRPYDTEKRCYELGFHFKPEFWGKGLATEAACAVMRFAFGEMNADKLFAGHNPNNMASKKVLEKLGFKYIGDEFYEPTGLSHPSYECDVWLPK